MYRNHRIWLSGDPGFMSMVNDTSATKLLIHSDTTDASTTITDSSSSGKGLVVAADAQHSTTKQKWGKTALKFDGTGDYITTTFANVDFDFSDGDMTIDFWVYFDDISTDRGFYGYYDSDTDFCALYWAQATTEVTLDFMSPVGNDDTHAWTWSPSADVWYHVALTRWGGSSINVFIDGVALEATHTISDDVGSSTDAITIGAAQVSSGGGIMYHQGYIDEFRIVKGKAMWTTAFLPPKGPYT